MGFTACESYPQGSDVGDEHLLFEKNADGDGYTVTGLDEECTDERIVIPATYDLPVTTIGDTAFMGRNHIEEVVLSSEITEIQYGTFAQCEGLKTISLPKRLWYIGGYVFYMCTSLKQVELPPVRLGL